MNPFSVGNRPPAMVPKKGTYMHDDVERIRELYKIPINHPSVSSYHILTVGKFTTRGLLLKGSTQYLHRF